MKLICWVGSGIHVSYICNCQYRPQECPMISEGQWMEAGAKTDPNTTQLLVLQCLFNFQLQMDVDHLREFITLVAMKPLSIKKSNIIHLLVKYNRNMLHY
jgi:hypothetical protein